MKLIQRLTDGIRRNRAYQRRLELMHESLGRIESRLNQLDNRLAPCDNEFKVYSQWGEDGIIDSILARAQVSAKTFIEFGVENYREANTLFLLKHRHWTGLVIDGSQTNIDAIRRDEVFWRHDLSAACAFITKDNIDRLIVENGFKGDVGLLSVDIDGNDYWVWDAITSISPQVVVSEYNSLFGSRAMLSTPYRADFMRTGAHPSNMYYGASIAALNYLAERRHYSLVAGNSAGNNVFFVRNDCLGQLKPQTVDQAYRPSAFREARSESGEVLHLEFSERQAVISHLPVVDVKTGRQMALKDAL